MGQETARFRARLALAIQQTGYVVAGMIAEKVSGEPLLTF